MFHVGDVMNEEVVSVARETPVRRVAELLVQHRVAGLPVLDEQGGLVGLVSEFDLLKLVYEPEIEDDPVHLHMSANPLAVSIDTPLTEVVDIFLKRMIRRLPVVEGNRLVGLVSRHDLIRFVRHTRDRLARARTASKQPEAAIPDACASG